MAGWVSAAAVFAASAFFGPYLGFFGSRAARLTTEHGTSSGEPVKILYAQVQPRADGSDNHVLGRGLFLTAGQLRSLNSLNINAPAYQQWFSRRGAVSADEIQIQLVVQGNRAAPVRIVNMQPVASCHAPLLGTLFYNPAQGADPSAHLGLDLDHPLAPASYLFPSELSNRRNYFEDYTVSLRRDEQFTFQIAAWTYRHYCTFSLDLTIIADGRIVTEVVKDHGQPFAVTAIPPLSVVPMVPGNFEAYRAIYAAGVAVSNYGSRGWVRENPVTYDGGDNPGDS